MSAAVDIDAELEALFDGVMKTAENQTVSIERHFDKKLWSVLRATGLTHLTTSDGAEAGWAEAAALLRAAARHGAAVPLAENDVLASWLVERAGMPNDPSVIRTVALVDDHGIARRVPWASAADRIVVIAEGDAPFAADVPASRLRVDKGYDLAGAPSDTVSVDLKGIERYSIALADVREYRLRGALARAVQMTGAMDATVEQTVRFASDRIQFGRPIARFQAIQHLIADLASEVALSHSAVDAAVYHLATGEPRDLDQMALRVAVAKSVTGHAASVVVRNAHQVHGAIGTTLEHPLHVFTNAILAWRSEFGSAHYWDQTLTELILKSGQPVWALAVPTP
jgi:acyl-CoA dehydrogenase